jgi:NitT/TauT family transport system ATP-binding protein
MLQKDCLLEWRNIYKNLILGLEIEKNVTEENINYIKQLVNRYGLSDFMDRYPFELSGGMRQRISLIRTLAVKPDILLLDEAFSALDYQTRLEVCDDVYRIIKDQNVSTILVTHDISEAISLCDRIIVLSKRPASIKSIYEINLENKSTPINNRKDKKFNYYYDAIWKDIDFHV